MADLLRDDDDILDALNERSEADIQRECEQEEDHVEYEEQSDEYDSDADPEYIPDEDDMIQLENDAIDYDEMENETIEAIRNAEQVEEPSTSAGNNRPDRRRRQRVHNDQNEQGRVGVICEIDGEDGVIVSENGFIWGTESNATGARIPARNIVHIRPGPTITARQACSPLECFKLFFNQDMLDKVLRYTNEEIAQQQLQYRNIDGTVSSMCLEELNALLGVIVLAAALKDNHLSTELMFDNTFSGDRYRATMSERRFKFLINCLRFDDRRTREERKRRDKFAPVTDLWNILLENCTSLYKPGTYVAIDEQLLGFRGRCPFRMYMPSKPNKYGIKILMMCDNATKYMINACVYLGKGTVPVGIPAADYFVGKLSRPIEMTNRNITMDNWFTSVPLVQTLLVEKHLTVVGTVKQNKPQFPSEFTDKRYKKRKAGTSAFLFRDDMTAVSYKPKANSMVCLLSSMHDDNSMHSNGKPEIVMVYNATKGAVDTFDQMCSNMDCNRKTQRWPLCIFYNMMNISLINAYVVYVHNIIRRSEGTAKPMSRQQFMLELHKELAKPWQEARMNQPRMSKSLKTTIEKVLVGERNVRAPAYPDQQGPRSYCSFCPSRLKRMTTTYCSCGKKICGQHQQKVCPDCAEL